MAGGGAFFSFSRVSMVAVAAEGNSLSTSGISDVLGG